MNEDFLKITIEILLSGVVAALVTFLLQRHYLKYDLKYKIISDIFKYRYNVKSKEFTTSLNQIFLTFYDDMNVIKAVDEFNNALNNKENTKVCNNKLYNIYFYMCKNIKLKAVDEKKFCDKVFNVEN